MSFVSTYFSYNGVRSEDMGIHLIKMDTGFIESQFWGENNINYEMVTGNDTPFYYSKRTEPFSITLQLSPLDGIWTSELKNKVSRWLNNGKFNEFYSTDDITRVYFMQYVGSPMLQKTAHHQGYIEVEFLNVDCYVRSPIYEKIFQIDTDNPTFIELDNSGSTTYSLPEMWIEKIGNGDLTLVNYTDGGRIFEFENLINHEVVFVDNRNRHIESNITDRLLYDSFNKKFFRLVYGINRIQVRGRSNLKFRYRQLFSSQ